jgi:tetratricopeptide (TPR) repeat protein
MPALALALILLAPSPQGLAAGPQARQIHWQRSLEDALAVARIEERGILVAVNMDGESASERIVRERYRDPSFVATTRPFVCLVSSAFRHTPRDHDERGRRIVCPRLGEITCGEHVALEPILHERFLGGERISPRHALILSGGEKAFDLFLLFDLRELDSALARAAAEAAPAGGDEPAPGASWTELAGSHRNRTRQALESRLAGAGGAEILKALQAIRSSGNAGWVDLLRMLFASRAVELGAPFVRALEDTALGVGVEIETAAALREHLVARAPPGGTPGLDGDALLIAALGRMNGIDPALRTLLLSWLALGSGGASGEGEHAAAALRRLAGEGELARLEETVALAGGAFDPARFLEWARGPGHDRAAAGARPAEALVPEGELESELVELERRIRDDPADSASLARRARALLALARQRMARSAADTGLLFEDAWSALQRALELRPDDVELRLDAARAAFHMGRHEEQERIALEALRLTGGLPSAAAGFQALEARDLARHEALRWLGDAEARLLSARSGGDGPREVEGLARGAWALAAAASGPLAQDSDWVSLASFFAAVGRWQEEAAFASAGVERWPESDVLRAALNRSLWNIGRPDLAASTAARIAEANPDSAASAWYEGYARIHRADWLRRGEEPELAIEAYRCAAPAFERARELRADFADSSGHYLALAALGRGFAHLLAERRAEAAEALVEAIAIRPAIAGARDSLGREAVDLLDGALEWRAAGASPVDSLELARKLLEAEPGNGEWALRISDSELREALRADGRGEPQVGERYLERALEAARLALAADGSDESRRALAQAANVAAERHLRRGELGPARERLAEAAPLLGEEPPAAEAGAERLAELAGLLRERLGPARPIVRPGR